jgi:hypothetical protein
LPDGDEEATKRPSLLLKEAIAKPKGTTTRKEGGVNIGLPAF